MNRNTLNETEYSIYVIELDKKILELKRFEMLIQLIILKSLASMLAILPKLLRSDLSNTRLEQRVKKERVFTARKFLNMAYV